MPYVYGVDRKHAYKNWIWMMTAIGASKWGECHCDKGEECTVPDYALKLLEKNCDLLLQGTASSAKNFLEQ